MIRNAHITIEGIRLKILSLDIQKNHSSQYGYGNIPTTTVIKMIAETTTNYYMTLEKWRDDTFDENGLSKPASSYKKNFIRNGLKIMGIFPTDYSFRENDLIEVTFSIDYINYDLESINLFMLKQERLKKLKKLKEISWE
jgi:hypothetical protein